MQHLAGGSLPSLHMERRAGAYGRPEPLPFPAALRIVDPSVHPFGVKARRIGTPENDPLAVLEGEETVGRVPRADRHIPAKTEAIELIYPRVIAGPGTPPIRDTLELRQWLRIEGPPFGTVLPRRGRSVERA